MKEASHVVVLLRDCAKKRDLRRGSQLHEIIVNRGLLKKCSHGLITMYAKCGALVKAQELLDRCKCRDVLPWMALIEGYVQNGQGQEALHCFKKMQQERVSPDAMTYSCILKACASIGAVGTGEKIHAEIAKQGLLEDSVVVSNALVDMYVKCGALMKAQQVLEGIPMRNVVSWSTLIAGYARQGQGQPALNYFAQMLYEGISPDAAAFVCALKACGSIQAVDKGEEIHEDIFRRGLLEDHCVLGIVIVDMYVKCGAMAKARSALEELPICDVATWNALITGYAQYGQAKQAFNCFEQMQHEGCSPDGITFTCVLKVCGSTRASDKGIQIHNEISNKGLLGNDVILGNALVDMYVKCDLLQQAQELLEGLPLQNVVTWNAVIAGYAQQYQAVQALHCFDRIKGAGLSPDAVTLLCILKACGSAESLEKGEQFFCEMDRKGLLGKDVVLWTALVDMYVKCGAMLKAQRVFEDVPFRDDICWNALMSGYADLAQGNQALNLLEQMQYEGCFPNAVTFLCSLKACGSIGAVDKGTQIHDMITRQGFLCKDTLLGIALVDMYAKCGVLAKARHVLERLSVRDVVSWSTLIAGYTEDGQEDQALECFEQMQREGFSPNKVTFLCILKACSSIGAAEKGKQVHDAIHRQGLMRSDIDVGNALVHMYSKSGVLAKAQQVFGDLPIQNIVCWNSLIAGYAQQGLAEEALNSFEQLQFEGLCPDAVTFFCILKAYGSMGSTHDAELYFTNMTMRYTMQPDIKHCSCMVDVFGRAGYLDKAVVAIQKMPFCDYSSAVWLALLVACWKWGDVKVARWAFEHAIYKRKAVQ